MKKISTKILLTKTIAIIGATASGKSALALNLAKQLDAYILSLDSLAVYKEIDIVSAKPSRTELKLVKHFAIDIVDIDVDFNAFDYLQYYQAVKKICQYDQKHLIIAGGTSFYLKVLLEGLSETINIEKYFLKKSETILKNEQETQKILQQISSKVHYKDHFRAKKHIAFYLQTGNSLEDLQRKKKKEKALKEVQIFELSLEKDKLWKNILKRSQDMISNGGIEEVYHLMMKYDQNLKIFNSIGIKEIKDYLNANFDKTKLNQLIEKISIHTRQFAKRQNTFNKNQFSNVIRGNQAFLSREITTYFANS